MKQKRLLLTGGSHAELPLIEAAKRQGWYVITTGTNKSGLGHACADEYTVGDFSDREYVLALARDKRVDAIVSGCNDFAYLATAYACEKLGLPGHDSYEVACLVHHKHTFRAMASALGGMRTPRHTVVQNAQQLRNAVAHVGLPLFVKPVDLTGGKGVRCCATLQDVEAAYAAACQWTREPVTLLEECIQGTNHGASLFLRGQRVVWSFFDNEQYYLNPYLVSGASSPSNLKHHTMVQLICDVEKLATYLSLCDGLFHIQFIVDPDDCPVLIDPCRRAPGDLYILLASYAGGVDVAQKILSAETGQDLGSFQSSGNSFVARQCIMAEKCGIITDIHINDRLRKYIKYKLIWAKKGDQIFDSLTYKAGILLMEFASFHELREVVDNFHELAKVSVENQKPEDAR